MFIRLYDCKMNFIDRFHTIPLIYRRDIIDFVQIFDILMFLIQKQQILNSWMLLF